MSPTTPTARCGSVLRAIYVASDQAGLNPVGRQKVGCHSLRHTAAALMLDAGLSLPKVSRALGHANVQVTATVYAGLSETGFDELRDDMAAAFAR